MNAFFQLCYVRDTWACLHGEELSLVAVLPFIPNHPFSYFSLQIASTTNPGGEPTLCHINAMARLPEATRGMPSATLWPDIRFQGKIYIKCIKFD